ncbi:hypothetical protein [Mucisphaera sp.]|uniref:hypothetical protein n=1 Tax=Mucisphaera sp. TaxID=2913024 RepID=UPI003D0E52A3
MRPQACMMTASLMTAALCLTSQAEAQNLLIDGSFAPDPGPALGVPDSNFVGGWQAFSNAFPNSSPSVEFPNFEFAAFDGDDTAAKMFGSFFSGGDSVLIQRVTETQVGETFDGQTFEATVRMLTPSQDTVVGTQNVALSVINFFDSGFNLIEGSSATSEIIDGRIPSTPVDTWVESVFTATAPANTFAVELVHVFVQTQNNFDGGFLAEVGSVWVDANELILVEAGFDLDANGDSLVNADDIDFLYANGQEADVPTWLSEFGTIPADANLDGAVDLIDLSALATNFGASVGWAGGNFNGDSTVDLIDLSTLATNFGGSPAIPEPASAALLGLAALSLGRRR